jgi:glycosyltransferase involved in cell wall biosynthesis
MDNIPFVVDYWKGFAERVIVYDNGSDDGSVEYLSQYPWIEVRQFKTNGFDDTANMNIKNSCWKESIGIADFVVVSDLDECLYSPVLESELDYMKANDITICGPRQYAL